MKVKDIQSGEIQDWDLETILAYINADRSAEWADYDATDWKEGWDEWCEGDIWTLLDPINVLTQAQYAIQGTLDGVPWEELGSGRDTIDSLYTHDAVNLRNALESIKEIL
tara:strand:- start:310 stop:639 length:330 start_codon:yes stop_codon:yes gene_type:complete